MSVRPLLRALPGVLFATLCAGSAAAQEQKTIAFPQRDILSPFRKPAEVYAPPDHLFALLRRMRSLADDPNLHKEFDAEGREIVDHEGWRNARQEVDTIGIDASYLAAILRMSGNGDDRATSLYAMFFCKQPDLVANLISHIPGEPELTARQQAYPRAIAWLKAHLGKRFGDLPDEEKKRIVMALPQPGSPAAKAAGITRAPRDEDPLLDLRLIPFFQLLDLDTPIDQAQGLWFLKEVFLIRTDLAAMWTEPALPRIRQLLLSEDKKVRAEAIGLLQAIGPKDLPPISVEAKAQELQDWADRAVRRLFPPIRNLNDTIVQLYPSPERDALVAAGKKALEGDTLGDPTHGRTKDGQNYRGFCVRRVPDELKALAIPEGAVITMVNGLPVTDAKSLLQHVLQQIESKKHPRVLMVEYVHQDAQKAIEYRIQ